jgi:hypothetical protein
MGVPSSQISAVWVQDELASTTWVLLRDVLFSTLRKKLAAHSDEDLWDVVESNLSFVAEHLRNCVADWVVDGSVPRFEIDNDPSPYIRLTTEVPSEVVAKLRKIDPFEFEHVCANVLAALGATSRTTQRTKDGGIDFLGVNLKVVPTALSVPASSKTAVIGQAKRYKDGNAVSETQLREFVGAATLGRHKLLQDGIIGPLSPVIFAFWTTSDFDHNAKQFARELGLWYMDGVTLAGYVTTLGLKEGVMVLADAK